MTGTRPPAADLLRVEDMSIEALSPDGDLLPLVKHVGFSCKAGEITALIGESGSGKSLTAAALLGVLAPETYVVTTGDLAIAGHRMARYTADALVPVRGSKVGYVVQDPGAALDPTMRVGDQLAELFTVHRGLSRDAARREAVRLLDLVRIPNAAARANDYPHAFSGGMKQRVIIAGAVALSPQILVADEPTTALDVTVQAEILALIDELRTASGMAVLLITHDLGVVYQAAQQVLVMYAGRIVESGDVETICTAPSHPYTAGLLASVPDLSRPGAVTAAIPGQSSPARARPWLRLHPALPRGPPGLHRIGADAAAGRRHHGGMPFPPAEREPWRRPFCPLRTSPSRSGCPTRPDGRCGP